MAAPQDGDIPTRVRLYVIKATLKLLGQMILKWLGQVLTLTFLHYSKLLLLTVSIGIIIKTIMSGCIFMFSIACSNFSETNQKTNGQFWKPALRDVTNGPDTWLKAVLPTVRC